MATSMILSSPSWMMIRRSSTSDFRKSCCRFFDAWTPPQANGSSLLWLTDRSAWFSMPRSEASSGFEEYPPRMRPLPMLEPAIVFGVSDAALLKQAMSEYRSITNDAIAQAREMLPFIPALDIPDPQTMKVKSGTLYFYPVPQFIGLDPQIVPNAGLSSHVGVLAISEQHSERLLARTPLKVSSGPLADTKRHLAGALYFDWPQLIDAAAPWVDFGLGAAGPKLLAGLLDEPADGQEAQNEGDNLRKQVHTLLNILKVIRLFTSAAYLEDGILVTHTETIIKDI